VIIDILVPSVYTYGIALIKIVTCTCLGKIPESWSLNSGHPASNGFGRLLILYPAKVQELKRSTKYFANGTPRYTSSETEGLKNEMIAARKAMPGINRH
jgi:hypothetical protein